MTNPVTIEPVWLRLHHPQIMVGRVRWTVWQQLVPQTQSIRRVLEFGIWRPVKREVEQEVLR